MEIESASMRPLLKRVEEGFWVYTQRCGYMEVLLLLQEGIL